MPKIQKPLLAANFDPTKAKYPYIATPKIDGIRFLMIDGVAVSRTFKPIRNRYIQKILQEYLPDGIDGELTCGDTFQSSTSAIMSIDGEPDFKAWIFDYVDPDIDIINPFIKRIQKLEFFMGTKPFKYKLLDGGHIIHNYDELVNLENIFLEYGYEGVMLRDPNGTYKFGRSTTKENILLKVKRFLDDEAILIDILEKYSNQNPEEKDAFGYVKRSSSLDGMIPTGVAGTLIVRDKNGLEFGIGTGITDKLRIEIWNNKEKYLGKYVKYKYFPQGVKELPRHPVFLGFRDPDDM